MYSVEPGHQWSSVSSLPLVFTSQCTQPTRILQFHRTTASGLVDSLMALLSQIFDYARRNDQQKQYEALSAIFILPTEAGFNQLSQELQSISVC
jgi:hypothetical protein